MFLHTDKKSPDYTQGYPGTLITSSVKDQYFLLSKNNLIQRNARCSFLHHPHCLWSCSMPGFLYLLITDIWDQIIVSYGGLSWALQHPRPLPARCQWYHPLPSCDNPKSLQTLINAPPTHHRRSPFLVYRPLDGSSRFWNIFIFQIYEIYSYLHMNIFLYEYIHPWIFFKLRTRQTHLRICQQHPAQ